MIPALLLTMLLAAPVHASEAEALLRAGKIDEAVPAAEREALAAPSDIPVQERWIDLMLGLGLPGAVQEHFLQVVREHPTDPNAHYLAGRALTEAAASRTAFEHALRLDPDHARSYMGLGALHRAAGELREAAQSYQRALRLDPSLAEAWGGLLATTLASNDRAAVLAVARAATVAVPDAPEGWLAVIALSPSEAAAAVREVVRRVPADARVQAALANQLLLEGDGRGALEAARRARALAPTDKDAILAELQAQAMTSGTIDAAGHRALLDARQLQQTEPEAARAVWDSLVTRYPRCALPLLGRAGARAATDPAGQRADLAKAVAVDPQNVEAAASLGLLLAQAGDTKGALPLLDRAAAARPLDGALALADADVHRQAGDLAGAITRVTAAEATFPLDLSIAVRRVAYLSEAGRHTEAIDVARKALERMPDLRMELAVAAAATAGGRWLDAADIYESLGKRTGKQAFLDTAERLRQRAAAPKPAPQGG